MTSERDSELKQHLTCFGSIDQSSHIETSGLTEPPHGLLHPVSRETYQLITFQTRTYVCRVDRLTCRVHWASAALQTIVAGHELWLIDSNHISGPYNVHLLLADFMSTALSFCHIQEDIHRCIFIFSRFTWSRTYVCRVEISSCRVGLSCLNKVPDSFIFKAHRCCFFW